MEVEFEEVASFIHNREHPYWEKAKNSLEFCSKLTFEVLAAKGTAHGSEVAAIENEDLDLAQRARNFAGACTMALKMLKLVEASARKKEHSDRMAQQQDERIKKMQEAVEYANSDAVFWKGAALKYADRLVALGMSDFVKSYDYELRGSTILQILGRIENLQYAVNENETAEAVWKLVAHKLKGVI